MIIKKINHDEVSVFCSQLALLLNAGITPYEAVCLMLDDSSSKIELEYLNEIKKHLMEGESLSSSIISTNIFPKYVCDMLILGEETGTVDKILQSLADFYDSEHQLRESIKNALIYPFLMIFVMLLMILVLLVKILPTINQVYLQLGSTINGFASNLFKASTYLQSISMIIYVFFFIFLVILLVSHYLLGQDDAEYNLVLHLRFAKDISRQVGYSRFASCLGLITSSGLDIYNGLKLAKNVTHNEELNLKIDNIILHLQEEGDYIYEALRKEKIFTPIDLRMLQVAYKAGNPETILYKISKEYENAVTNKIQRILNSVEPSLIIVFSIIVGMILISALLPLIGIMSTIG